MLEVQKELGLVRNGYRELKLCYCLFVRLASRCRPFRPLLSWGHSACAGGWRDGGRLRSRGAVRLRQPSAAAQLGYLACQLGWSVHAWYRVNTSGQPEQRESASLGHVLPEPREPGPWCSGPWAGWPRRPLPGGAGRTQLRQSGGPISIRSPDKKLNPKAKPPTVPVL